MDSLRRSPQYRKVSLREDRSATRSQQGIGIFRRKKLRKDKIWTAGKDIIYNKIFALSMRRVCLVSTIASNKVLRKNLSVPMQLKLTC
mmetsp:Transcript_7984/g.11317  ORF Transcript_7984/g.11317 Transcript_7984/m.11317 type:complete len:88 (-) Transcript_7984:7-270(-)